MIFKYIFGRKWRELQDADIERQDNNIKISLLMLYDTPYLLFFIKIVFYNKGKGLQTSLSDWWRNWKNSSPTITILSKKSFCHVTDKFDHLPEHYSWKICKIDYYAATIFKNVSGLTYKEIMKNALNIRNQNKLYPCTEEIELR